MALAAAIAAWVATIAARKLNRKNRVHGFYASVVIGWYNFRRHRCGHRPVPHDADSREDRYRFLGYAGYLLSILCAVAVVFTTLVALFLGSCH